jgi:N-acetylglucosamine kinase-like BadF-type ATPase
VRHEPLVKLPTALLAPADAGQAAWLMGVDGGATKTLAAVLDVGGGHIHVGHGGSSNPDSAGAQAATDALLSATDEALARAGIGREDLGAAVLAIAGTDTEAVASHVRARAPSSWIVVNDVVGAWASATGAGPGVAAISGTGSNVFGVGGGAGGLTRSWRAGGWGHVLGDEGSGYWLALQSIRAALCDRERSGPSTGLGEAAVEFFKTDSVEALAQLVYSKPLTKGEIAAFAVETARLARAGDAVAARLYERAAAELGRQIGAVIRETGLQGRFPVGLIGSAFKAGSVFIEPLATVVHDAAPDAEVAVVEMAPVGGCLLLAARAAGCAGAVGSAELKRSLDETLAREGSFRD